MGVVEFALGLMYTIIGKKTDSSIIMGVGISVMIAGPLITVLIWCLEKLVFGLFYDVKLIRYKIEEVNSKNICYNAGIKEFKSKNPESKSIHYDLPYEKYDAENTMIIIQGRNFWLYRKYFDENRLVMFGIVIDSDDGIILTNNTKKIPLKKIDEDLQAANGVIYKKVASN